MNKLYRGDALAVLRRLPDCSVQCVSRHRRTGVCAITACLASSASSRRRKPMSPAWSRCSARCGGSCGMTGRCAEYRGQLRRRGRGATTTNGMTWQGIGRCRATNRASTPIDQCLPASSPRTSAASPGGSRSRSRPMAGIRGDIIWHKPNPMPESVRDRPTKAHEYVFLMTKSARYFWDAEAVREEADRMHGKFVKTNGNAGMDIGHTTAIDRNGFDYEVRLLEPAATSAPSGPSPRGPSSGAHFATFPPALVDRCIKAGTSERGCCPHCGKPWERVTEMGIRICMQLAAANGGWSNAKEDRRVAATKSDHPSTLPCKYQPSVSAPLAPAPPPSRYPASARSLHRQRHHGGRGEGPGSRRHRHRPEPEVSDNGPAAGQDRGSRCRSRSRRNPF